MANVYELKNTFNTLWNIIEDETADDEVILDAWQTACEDLADKLENCCKYIKNQEAIISGLKDEEARIKAKRQALENGVDRLKDLMKSAIETSGEKKIPCGSFTCAVQNNAPKLVLDVDMKYIPEKYLVPQPPTVDKNSLKEDLKNGVEGLGEIAHLETTNSLRIR